MPYETLVIGILLALLWVELVKIYPGGLIVPAYLALHLDTPLRILTTLGVALLSLLIFRVVSGYWLLFGRRRFVFFILLGGLIGQAWYLFSPHLFADSAELRAVGWLIPGLLANNLERQKMIPTLASLGIVTLAAFFLTRLISHAF